MSQLVHRQLQQHRFAHTVRIICCQDLPNGAASRHQVTQVKAGYARNYLLPQKLAVYATRANFDKFNLVDPELETLEQRRARQAAAAAKDDDVEAHAADILRRYLAHKTLKIWRNVEAGTSTLRPGMVDAKAVRQKLAKQLRIDLEPGEKVVLSKEPFSSADWAAVTDVEALLADVPDDDKVQIRQLGEYVAKICLRGGHTVPLRLEVLPR